MHGWDVINFDRVPSPDPESGAFYEVNVELTDMGQVLQALQVRGMLILFPANPNIWLTCLLLQVVEAEATLASLLVVQD